MEKLDALIAHEGEICRIRLKGHVNLKNSFALKEMLRQKCDEGFKEIILDFEGDVYLDSSAIGAIFTSQRYLIQNEAVLKLRNVSSDIMTVLKIAKLDKHLNFI